MKFDREMFSFESNNNSPELTMAMTMQILLFVLGLWGCMAIYNSQTLGPSPLYFVGKQLLWLVSGMAILFIVQRIPFSIFRENADLLCLLAYIPLLAVLVFGTRVNGMKGWFSLGFANINLQPSEFSKPFFILSLCHFGFKYKPGMKRFLTMGLVTLIWVLPIMLQPDFGTAMIYVAGFITVYWLTGGTIWHILLIPTVAIPGITWFLLNNSYALKRISGFLNPALDPLDSGWHIRQFQFTLARGGWMGTKLGKAIWANSYLPLAHSDSVFASMTESLGFIGTMPVILLIATITYIVYRLALLAKNSYRKVFIFGMGGLFAFQALVHISVNVTLIPPTGLTLPILSYGGSSLVATLFGFGILLSAASIHDQQPDNQN
ncbi:MAG: FtsW/RodA/SpoVE family cell cycle protein [Victivallaceae bacterium]